MLVAALGWLAAAVGMLSSLPQLWKLLRHRQTAGCSLLLWQLSMGNCLAWTGHGVIIGAAPMILPNLVLALVALLIIATLCRARGRSLPLVVLGSLALAATCLTVDVLLGPVAFAAVVFVPALVGVLAQLRVIATGLSLDGVSAGYLVVAVLMQGLWLCWAVLSGDISVLLVGSSMLGFATLSLGWYLGRRTGIVAAIGRARGEDLTLAA
ncbi:PQ-loop domain-containing transporter [Desertihabitans aurantiacus]|uniref:PQ-loop domain-containing transporter n=1 Tax=Desertihabitans aurantiacus TaxID=2282477 RepID=UPI000DF7873B|nr:PQ-loop domain-containing transporter [Desertihabitans aurantiacus]